LVNYVLYLRYAFVWVSFFVYVLSFFFGVWRLQDKICCLETVKEFMSSDLNLAVPKFFVCGQL